MELERPENDAGFSHVMFSVFSTYIQCSMNMMKGFCFGIPFRA